MDSALTEFLSRFGDPSKINDSKTEFKKMSSPNPGEVSLSEDRAPVSSVVSEGLKSSNFNINDSTEKGNVDTTKIADEVKTNKLSGLMDNVGDYADVGMGAVQLAGFAKGNQYNTNPNSGGPGSGKGQILQGAATGMQMGKMFGPIGMAGGALAGGLISTFAHKGAVKDWRKNQIVENTKKENEKTAKRKDEYAMSEGLASVSALKQLRERQLGTYTT